ncbi:MAG TPA: DNA gyrase C-terminal beta-propeller domain-containing protein, partial [Caulobacteraceae bacterium]|nr:DNA gyrase C-terminal beta-propeller domain-containing protein [Caulobacteraceae bacterium]
VPCETTDKLLIFASDGRFFTLGVDKLPSARGHGEPLSLMVDFEEGTKVLAVLAHKPGRKLLLASKAGYGFVLPEEEALASRRAGKQVLNGEPLACLKVEGDQLAVIGDNQKVLVFPVSELPEMPRGKGVKLQSYKDGGLRDAAVFSGEAAPEYVDASGRRRAWNDWKDWAGKRAQAGRPAPKTMRRFR